MTPREALAELGVAFVEEGQHHHVRQGWLGTDCPMCSPGSGRIRLGLNLSFLYLNCWTCGRLPLHETLAELSGRTAREVGGLLRGVRRTSRPSEVARGGKLIVPDGVGELLPPHLRYLQGRGFDPDYLKSVWGIQGVGPRTGLGLAWRLFIPIRIADKTVSWTARSISEQESVRRYHNARPHEEAVPAKHTLYGIEHVRHGVIVHEGPTDVWRTGPGAVATMGLAYTRKQVLILSQFPVRIVAFDSEPQAQKRAVQLCEALAPFPGRTERAELDAADPGSACEKEIKLLRRMIR